ncbi:Veg family protein [Peptoniphilus raoultii]|uniref:Veg family protein n=1 Tax=Peptoniphilus raoultii TaxID=1776387 RepID=UPI0008D92CFD|nr:Veg family protein [Peptoniphilus raoultii]
MNQMDLIKNELKSHIGKRIIVKANKGRKKIITRRGVLKAIYPSLFVVDIFNGNEIITSSFTYSDVLTSTVKLTILEDEVKFSDAKMIS